MKKLPIGKNNLLISKKEFTYWQKNLPKGKKHLLIKQKNKSPDITI